MIIISIFCAHKDLRANIGRWDDFLIIIERKKLTETQVYNQPKTPKGLTVPVVKPSVQPLKIDLNYLHSNREMVSIEHKTS